MNTSTLHCEFGVSLPPPSPPPSPLSSSNLTSSRYSADSNSCCRCSVASKAWHNSPYIQGEERGTRQKKKLKTKQKHPCQLVKILIISFLLNDPPDSPRVEQCPKCPSPPSRCENLKQMISCRSEVEVTALTHINQSGGLSIGSGVKHTGTDRSASQHHGSKQRIPKACLSNTEPEDAGLRRSLRAGVTVTCFYIQRLAIRC